jgi:hypothetical protein
MRAFGKSQSILICTLAVILISSTGWSQSALSQRSDKDLLRQAQLDADPKVNKLDEAREALLVIVERAAAKKKNPDKKCTELLGAVNKRIGEREAAVGEAACARMDFPSCQKQSAIAKTYDPSSATQLEVTLQTALTKLEKDFWSAVAQAEQGDPEGALTRLAGLTKYEAYLPKIKAESERIRGLLLKRLNDEGQSFLGKRQWDDASARFRRVLDAAPNNEAAKNGLAAADRGRKGYSLSAQASEQLKDSRFEEASETIKAALAAYPEAKSEFEQLQKKIMQSWVSNLLTEMPELVKNGETDFQKSLEAHLKLQRILELDPTNPEVAKYADDINKAFTANATQRAQALADLSDLSKIGTATVLKFDARRLVPDLIPLEDLKDAMGKFNRKRVSQLVLSVENVGSGATQEFTQSVQARASSIIDKQSLKDLRLRGKEDYEKDPKDDVQFQSLRPDGKSYTALLTVNITKCDWQRKSVDRSSEMKSSYIDGTRQEPNPKYEEQARLLDQITRALNDPARRNKDKPTKEGYTATMLLDEKDKLSRIPQFLVKDKIVEYPYQRIEYTQNTDIEIEIMLRDYGSKQEIDRQTISYSNVDKGVEIAGIKERDQNQLQNQALRMPDRSQALEEGLRYVRENLDKILPRLIHSYTDRFFAEGEKAYKVGNVENAVEAFLCHWAFYGGKLEPGAAGRITRVVKEATGFDLEKQGGNLMSELLKVLQ